MSNFCSLLAAPPHAVFSLSSSRCMKLNRITLWEMYIQSRCTVWLASFKALVTLLMLTFSVRPVYIYHYSSRNVSTWMNRAQNRAGIDKRVNLWGMNEAFLEKVMFSSPHHDIWLPHSLSVCVCVCVVCEAAAAVLWNTARERKSVLKCGLLCNPSQGPFAIFVPGSARHGWVFSLVTSSHQ